MINVFLDKVPQWVRWIFVLPAALLGFLIIQLIIAIGQIPFGGLSSDNVLQNGYFQFINSIAGAYFFVHAGCWAAPSGKKVTSIVLSSLFTFFIFALLWVIITFSQVPMPKSDFIWYLVCEIPACATAIYASIMINKTSPEN